MAELSDPGAIADAITVPVRWCIVEGSAMANGVTVPANLDGVWPTQSLGYELNGLTDQASDQIWMPSGAHIRFLAAAAELVPVIRDSDQSEGGLGDVGQLHNELSLAIATCGRVWNSRFHDCGIPVSF